MLRAAAGYSLIELMVAVSLGLMVVTAAGAIYVSTVESSADNLKMARLNQDLRAAMYLMTAEIRRAGYWAGVPGVDDFADNPFMSTAGGTDLAIGAATGEPASSCVTFAYDLDKDGLVGIGTLSTPAAGEDDDNVERFGLRLVDGAIQSRTSGATFDCDSGNWAAMTEPSVDITALAFTLGETCLNASAPGTACASGLSSQYIRRIGIDVTGRLAGDPDVQQAVAGLVRLRNDKFVAVTP